MNPEATACIAFDGDRSYCVRRSARGRARGQGAARPAQGGRDPDLRRRDQRADRYRFSRQPHEVLARLPGTAETPAVTDEAAPPASRGPGRPKLGVVAREVTLLPRHWDWLAQQRGGASVALRRLVDEARRSHQDKDRIRHAQEAAYRFLSATAGNRANYEAAIRALFADEAVRFAKLIADWPADIRKHALALAGGHSKASRRRAPVDPVKPTR